MQSRAHPFENPKIVEATEHAEHERAAGLRADAAWYDPASDYLMMRMSNRRLFGVPAKDIPYLNLLFDSLGARGVTGVWAKAAGKQTSPAKAKAARANGAKGGRPRKTKAA